jgi:hypothetical protein
MIISSSITIGQITFVLRVAVQILSYGGLALITLIIIANAPRVAPIDTHNVVSYVIAKSNCTSTSAKWVFNRLLRGGRKDPLPSTTLLIALFMFISYTGFVAISDVGFLGFYACSVPGPNLVDSPASITSDAAARALVARNLINGSDPSTIMAHRCDAVQVVKFGSSITQSNCTAWRNSTYADTNLFTDVNSTDTDVLMPRQLSHYDQPRAQFIDLNSYYIGPDSLRVTNSTIQEGVALFPHDAGVRIVLGVPQLAPLHEIYLNKTLAVEVEVGCMALGVYTIHDVSKDGVGFDVFAAQGDWRQYSGPEYFREALSNATDAIREYYLPFFNTSSLDPNSGMMTSINQTSAVLTNAANIVSFILPSQGIQSGPDIQILANCTVALQNQLGIPISQKADGSMCGLLALGGSYATNGTMSQRLTRAVCATSTQINMVAVTVAVDTDGQVSLNNFTRLPSDLNYLRADYWDMQLQNNTPTYTNFIPYERYTLNDNPNSPTTHFIPHNKVYISEASVGPGSGGSPLSQIGDLMLARDYALSQFSGLDYAGIFLLQEGFNAISLNVSAIPRWCGQLGASFFAASTGYNGWAALTSAPIRVVSTGGRVGSCYKPLYAIGFLPIVLAALVVFVWSIILLVRSSLLGSTPLQRAYAGMGPYRGTVCPGAPVQDTLLAWEAAPEPHLQVVNKGYPIVGDAPNTASMYLKAGNGYPFSA